jgi:multiple sugar transport system permease protein
VDDAAHVDADVSVLHRVDPPVGRALMAAVVGSRRRRRLQAGLVYAALIMLAAIFLFPLLWVLGLSLKTRLQVFASPPLFVWRPTLENYIDVLGRSDFLMAFFNTLVVSGSAVMLSLCVGMPAAYAFARFPFRGRSLLFFALLVMRMLPPIAVLVPMYVLFSKVGLTTTRLSVVLAYSTFSLPLVVWIMRGFFEDLPRELEESAWIDGASRYGAFLQIVLPLARPGMMAASILCLQLAWNDFLFAAVMTNNATQTLPVKMMAFSAGDSGVDWGAMTASGMLVIVPVIIFSFAAQRHLVAGLSSGAVKG